MVNKKYKIIKGQEYVWDGFNWIDVKSKGSSEIVLVMSWIMIIIVLLIIRPPEFDFNGYQNPESIYEVIYENSSWSVYLPEEGDGQIFTRQGSFQMAGLEELEKEYIINFNSQLKDDEEFTKIGGKVIFKNNYICLRYDERKDFTISKCKFNEEDYFRIEQDGNFEKHIYILNSFNSSSKGIRITENAIKNLRYDMNEINYTITFHERILKSSGQKDLITETISHDIAIDRRDFPYKLSKIFIKKYCERMSLEEKKFRCKLDGKEYKIYYKQEQTKEWQPN